MKPARELKKGDYLIHRNEPCRVQRVENVAYSTHSHTKLKIEVESAISRFKDILTLFPHTSVEDADIIRKKGQLISKNPVQVMDLVSFETFNAEVPGEGADEISEGDEVTFIEFGGKAIVLEKR